MDTGRRGDWRRVLLAAVNGREAIRNNVSDSCCLKKKWPASLASHRVSGGESGTRTPDQRIMIPWAGLNPEIYGRLLAFTPYENGVTVN